MGLLPPPPPLRLERLKAEAWPVLKGLRLAALRQAPEAFTSRYQEEAAQPDGYWQALALANAQDERSAGFLAFVGPTPVGLLACLWQDKPRGLVRLVSLWVAPAARRCGVASALVERALLWAKDVGALACEADVTQQNHGAEVFYWRHGFRRVPAHPRQDVSRWLRDVQPPPTAPWTGEDEAVQLLESNPAWPAKFEEERRRLAEALAPFLDGEVEHVGSTAVPGLLAKPTVDLMAPVSNLDAASTAIPVLEGLGYLYAPYRPGLHWFCKPSAAHREFHLILLQRSNVEWARRIAFRNLLRAEPARARAYAELKRQAARQHAHDREAYTQAKARFVESLSEEALRRGYFSPHPVEAPSP
ncbi:MAG: GNAT family N-acetyltransferase [Myxococcaceae bacterium]